MIRALFPILAAILILTVAGPPVQAQGLTANVSMDNATNATLVLAFIRDRDPGEFRAVTLQPGESRHVEVPAGVVTMTITAPYSRTDLRYVGTDTLSVGGLYEFVLTESSLGVTSLRDDLSPDG